MKRFQGLIIILAFCFTLISCGGQEQLSGIVGLANFSTYACMPTSRKIVFKNDDFEKSQRIQAVLFEMGTNAQGYYKIMSVEVEGFTYTGSSSQVDEIIIPPGGSMVVNVEFNPKEVTFGEDRLTTYLDIALNGPKLGIIQIQLDGQVPATLPDCSADGGENAIEFEVVSMTTVISDSDQAAEEIVTELDVAETVDGNFKLVLDTSSGLASISSDGWPTINLPLPEGSPVSSVPIIFPSNVTYEGTVDSAGEIKIEDLEILVTGQPITADFLSTGSETITNTDGSVSRSGVPLDSNGSMTLVVGAKLDNPLFQQLSGGVFMAVIELQRTK